MTPSRRLFPFGLIAVAALAASGCGAPPADDLEIVEIRPADPGPLAPGDSIALEVDVKNNGRNAQTVSAARAGGAEMGLLLKGPAAEIRRNRTETLALELPVDRSTVRECEVVAQIFLARPGEPANIFRDLWTDGVPENHNREVRYPVARPIPTEISFGTPVTEVVENTTQSTLTRHYEATAAVVPEGSAWAIESLLLQSQDARSNPIELLHARFVGPRLITGSVIWDGAARRRDSVAQALVHMEYRDCGGEVRTWERSHVAVVLAPR